MTVSPIRRIKTLLATLLFIALGACSSGDNTVSPAGGAAGASVSGSIVLAARTALDTDINDPSAPFINNSSAANAQQIDNLVVLQGFATRNATGRPGDTFASTTDIDDFYQVNLQAGQSIQLQVVDYIGGANNFGRIGDLDLYLFDASLNLIAASEGTGEYERIQVPSDGNYFINVYAHSGSSKYVLHLTSASALSLHTPSMDFVTGQAIVTYEPTTTADAASKMSLAYEATSSQPAEVALFQLGLATKAKTAASTSDISAINPDTQSKLDTLRAIKALNQESIVRLAEPNYRRYATATPNDTFYPLQWHYGTISLPQAWNLTTGDNTVVAVVDTGVVTSLPDLQANMLPGYDFVADLDTAADGDGRDNDPTDPGSGIGPGSHSWHGTHVAGTIAAVTNNDNGVSGVAWNAKVIPVRVLGRGGGTAFDVIEGIKYAAGLANVSGTVPTRTADVINLSLGGEGFVQAEADLMRHITEDLGIIVVAAAGNSNTSAPCYPAAYAGVVSVSAVDFDGDRAPYSNFGNTIDLAAPGGDTTADLNSDGYVDGVLSTVVNDRDGSQAEDYSYLQGTSMAAPHVAGVAALMKSLAPTLTASDFNTLLISGQLTDDRGAAGRDNVYGHGMLNALKAVQAAVDFSNGTASQTPIVVASPSEIALGTDSESNLTLSNAGLGTPVLTSIVTDANWLVVTAVSTDASGLGEYRVSADRSLMSRGTYVGAITFSYSNATTVRVAVTATTNNVSTIGELAPHYVLLYDIDNQTYAAEVSGTASQGVLSYAFSDIPAGNYLVVAGTDVDADGIICTYGEACGLYPTISASDILELNGNVLSGIDFTTDIVSGLLQQANISPTEGLRLEKTTKTTGVWGDP